MFLFSRLVTRITLLAATLCSMFGCASIYLDDFFIGSSTPDASEAMVDTPELKSMCFADDFNRMDNSKVGNDWLQLAETEGLDSCSKNVCSNKISLVEGRVRVTKSVGPGSPCVCPREAHLARVFNGKFPVILEMDYYATEDRRIGATLGLATDANESSTDAGISNLIGVKLMRSSKIDYNSNISLIPDIKSLAASNCLPPRCLKTEKLFEWEDRIPIHISLTISSDGTLTATASQSGHTITISDNTEKLPANLGYVIVWDQEALSYSSPGQTMSAAFDNVRVCSN